VAAREVLVVDDDPHVREVIHQIFLTSGYRCLVAGDGREGVEVFRTERPPLVVTDLKMPAMDGIGLLQTVRAADSDAAVIVLTGAADMKTAIESLKLGAYDFIMKPVNMEELLIAAERALERRQLLIERREYQAMLEHRVEEATRDLALAFRELQTTYHTTLEALGSALDTRDIGTESHSRRVHGYALAVARECGITDHKVLTDILHGVLLHDIGKIGIPDAILLKPGPLTPDEWTIMRRHPEIGRRLIAKIPFLAGAAPIVYHHHEKWDGTGYPEGLKGEAIPLGARVFSVVDAFDAMTCDRPYSKAVSFEAAKAEIRRCSGSQFDPGVVEAFFRVPESLLAEIRRRSTES
jgi:response regulator RpfG family c-di-GMP phosphodiesterase